METNKILKNLTDLFITDAECDGLEGNFLSIAAVTTKDGEIDKKFYCAVKTKVKEIKNPWVKENVFPHLENAYSLVDTEAQLLESFRAFYNENIQYKNSENKLSTRAVVADVPCPVEKRLFESCNIPLRELYDLQELMKYCGISEDADREQLAFAAKCCDKDQKFTVHDAMDDTLISYYIICFLRSLQIRSSYHTFYFPFVWNNGGNSTFEDVTKLILNSEDWTETTVNSFQDALKEEHSVNADSSPEISYQYLQYFTDAAKQSAFGWDKNFVKCYSYRPTDIRNQTSYIIKKKKDNLDFDFSLNINAIKLKIFNTGIGVLIFETENHNHRFLADIKAINEYGRRIFAPYLNSSSYEYVLCADELGIVYNNNPQNNCISDFREIYNAEKEKKSDKEDNAQNSEMQEDSAESKKEEPVPPFEERIGNAAKNNFIPDFILTLFPKKLRGSIRSAIDDRMFVACLVNATKELYEALTAYPNLGEAIEKFSSPDGDTLIRKKEKKQWAVTDSIISSAKSLYELAFIDLEGSCSCQSLPFLQKLLEEAAYDRWSGYGTLHMMTHHSYICITTATEEYFTERPFLTEYTHMLTMVLAQRSAIIVFDEMTSRLTNRFKDKKRSLNLLGIGMTKQILRFQEKYIAFCNQHNNIEVTCQEQGIELYKKLQTALYVPENNEALEKEIELLCNAANSANDLKLNILAIVLSIILAIVAPFWDNGKEIISWIISFFTGTPGA